MLEWGREKGEPTPDSALTAWTWLKPSQRTPPTLLEENYKGVGDILKDARVSSS